MIRFRCQCGRQLQAAEINIGQPAKCPLCGQITTVPDHDDAPSAPPPQPSRPTAASSGEIKRRDEAGQAAELPRLRPTRIDDDDDLPPNFPRGGPFANPPQTCEDAKTALRLGLIGLFCCALVSPVALIYGIKAINQINNSDGALTGTGQAVTGIVLGSLGLLFLLLRLALAVSDNGLLP
jgi:hypothetical protein